MKDGGPAFPLPFIHDATRSGYGEYVDAEDAGVPVGLSIRDYFAGQALAGAIAEGTERGLGRSRAEELAEFSYACADSMLKARGEV